MIIRPIHQELGSMIEAAVPLRQIVSILREYRLQGLTAHELQQTLESLRDHAQDECVEDRILEVMDIASGFCSSDLTVWD